MMRESTVIISTKQEKKGIFTCLKAWLEKDFHFDSVMVCEVCKHTMNLFMVPDIPDESGLAKNVEEKTSKVSGEEKFYTLLCFDGIEAADGKY